MGGIATSVVELYGLYILLAIVSTLVKEPVDIYEDGCHNGHHKSNCNCILTSLMHFIVSKHNILVFLVGFSLKHTCMIPTSMLPHFCVTMHIIHVYCMNKLYTVSRSRMKFVAIGNGECRC